LNTGEHFYGFLRFFSSSIFWLYLVCYDKSYFRYGNVSRWIYRGAKEHVHLIFHNGAILNDKSGLLEGDYPDRRMVYFSNMKDVKAKKPHLKKL